MTLYRTALQFDSITGLRNSRSSVWRFLEGIIDQAASHYHIHQDAHEFSSSLCSRKKRPCPVLAYITKPRPIENVVRYMTHRDHVNRR